MTTATPNTTMFIRADLSALAAFDPRTKRCTMNCGKHRDDTRSSAERMRLCDDCEPATPAAQAR